MFGILSTNAFFCDLVMPFRPELLVFFVFLVTVSHCCLRPVPASLVLISPAIRIHPMAALARYKNALSAVPGLGGLAWLQLLPEFDPYKYNSFATNAGAVVHRLTRSVDERKDLHGVLMDSVHESVPIHEHFADRGIATLWDDPAAIGQGLQ